MIEHDLHFSPEAHLSGTVLEDHGEAMPGVRLEIRDCESLAEVDDARPGSMLDLLNESDIAPPSMKSRTTDAEGRFDFSGLPENCLFRIDVRAKGYPHRQIHAATTGRPQPPQAGLPVLTGDFRITLATPLDIPIRLITADTRLPAPRVLVQASGEGVSPSETTDDQGRATLRLPTGKYRLEYLPARGTSYLVTEGELIVGEKPPAEPIVLELKPAAILELTVEDADTGEGIPDVDLWWSPDPDSGPQPYYSRSWEEAKRIAWVDRPRTDARGVLRVLIEPGKHRMGVGLQSPPQGYRVGGDEGREIEARAGEVVREKFTLRKRR